MGKRKRYEALLPARVLSVSEPGKANPYGFRYSLSDDDWPEGVCCGCGGKSTPPLAAGCNERIPAKRPGMYCDECRESRGMTFGDVKKARRRPATIAPYDPTFDVLYPGGHKAIAFPVRVSEIPASH